MAVVDGAWVRIRPYVSPEDAAALAALDTLSHEIAEAFDRFHAAVSTDDGRKLAVLPTLEGDLCST